MTDASVEIDDSNILLFVRSSIGKEFTYYIRNLYIATARSMNLSILEYFTMYVKNEVGDPEQLRTVDQLVALYDLFDWSIIEILEESAPNLVKTSQSNKYTCAKAALIYIIHNMFKDYKIKRD